MTEHKDSIIEIRLHNNTSVKQILCVAARETAALAVGSRRLTSARETRGGLGARLKGSISSSDASELPGIINV